MGLSSFPCPADHGVLPLLVMNTVTSVALVKNIVRSVLFQVVGAGNQDVEMEECSGGSKPRRASITRYGSLCRNRGSRCIAGDYGGRTSANRWPPVMECCVCLCRFEDDEEVSELSCQHFFHKGCLDKWFDNQHTTCPLCRSMM